MCILMKVVLIQSCEWGSPRIFFFHLHKNGVFGFQKHYCAINESGFKFHFDSLLWRCFPGKFWKIKYQNGVFWARIEVLINLQMDISITENLYEKKCFSLYRLFRCVGITV